MYVHTYLRLGVYRAEVYRIQPSSSQHPRDQVEHRILDTTQEDTGYWILDIGYWILDIRILDTGRWIWIPGTGRWIPDTGLLGHRGWVRDWGLGAGGGWVGSMLLVVVYIVVDTLLYLHL